MIDYAGIFCYTSCTMGRKKQGNGRDSNPKYLGMKAYGGQVVKPGSIIVRQKGTRIHPGNNTVMGRDHTISSSVDGTIEFTASKNKKVVGVIPTPVVS